MKRGFTLFLAFVLLLGALPVSSNAEQAVSPPVDANQVTAEGANDLGAMLSEKVNQEQETIAQFDGGYSLTELTVENNQASVSYCAVDEAILVVALYSEDGLRLLTSGQTQVTAEEETAVVTFEGEMPEYFIAKAYMIHSDDYSPLCPVYETPMYTMQMQQLLASTVDDYDPALVLNLDEDKTTNFAVVSTAAKYIQEAEGANTVLQADRETGVYQIGNADEQFTQLQPGDVVVYPYGEDGLLIFKVASISQESDGIVTITAGDVEIDEVFSHMKLEDQTDAQDAVWDTENITPGISIQEDAPETRANTRAWDGEYTVSGGVNFEVKKDLEDGISVVGALGLKLEGKFAWYVSQDYQRAEWAVTVTTATDLTITMGKTYATRKHLEFTIIPIELPLIGGLACVSMTPSIVLELSATIRVQLSKMEATFGFWLEHDSTGNRIVPFFDSDLESPKCELKGEVFVGLALTPKVEIMESFVFAAQMKGKIGIELSAKTTLYQMEEGASTLHPCTGCFDGDISFVFKVTTSVELFKKPLFVNGEYTLLDRSFKFADFYLCDQHNPTITFGECPYIQHKITVEMVDENKNPIAEVIVELGGQRVPTDEKGVAEFYVPVANHLVRANYCGEVRQRVFYADRSQKIRLSFAEADEVADIFDMVTPDDAKVDPPDYGKVLRTGYCGDQGKNVSWTFYDSGILVFSGFGKMINFAQYSCLSDYLEGINRVVIGEGITYVGEFLLYSAESHIVSVSLPSTCQEIGSHAFRNCNQLRSVQLPVGLKKIGTHAFWDCSALLRISIPDTVTEIGRYASWDCTSLMGVNLPEGLTTIDEGTFVGCEKLNQIQIPQGVTKIGNVAFDGCKSLNKIVLPAALAELGAGAFYDCDALESVVIPSGVTEIADSMGGTFGSCDRLKYVSLPKGLTHIGENAFFECKALERINIPDSVTSIGRGAFWGCEVLKEVIIPEGMATIENGTFYNCKMLPTIVIPAGITTIEMMAFSSCTGLRVITFQGDAPVMDSMAFSSVRGNAYYPAGNETWTEEVRNSCGGTLFWYTYEKKESRSSEVAAAALPASTETRQVTAGTVVTTDVKTASFTDLVPGAQYVLLVLASPDAEDLLSRENLLYMDQKTASEDGTLSFQYLLPQMDKLSYVVVCGPSVRDLQDAQITWPAIWTNGETVVADPTVVYGDKTLTEGVDYILTGSVSTQKSGVYTCYVQGVGNYTGTAECTYTVTDSIPGDIDGNGIVDNKDVEYLLWHTLFPEDYSLNGYADFDSSGIVDNKDVEYLLWYTLFPEDYPLT